MNSLKKSARNAGLLYLLLAIAGVFNLIYAPGKLLVRGDAAATAERVLAHQTLFRIDLAVGLLSVVIFIFLVLALYRLFREVNQQLATLMVILVLVQVPQTFASQLLQLGAFELIRGADFLSALDKSQRDVLAMLCFHLNDLGVFLVEIFWGLWLFPLGWLSYRSGFIPRVLGIWLIVNGVAYVISSFTGLLAPQYVEIVTKITYPALFGELAFTLWLLVPGARPKRQVAT